MVRVRLFGSLRIRIGFQGMDVEAANITEVCRILARETGHEEKEFRRCLFVLNGAPCGIRARLADGDELMLLSPSGGG
ncbi:MAG: MoaD/ThiS family protein [Ndongobacter sp.]|nr:MoaD/ThiS family protein [Ndongobacter sp.]